MKKLKPSTRNSLTVPNNEPAHEFTVATLEVLPAEPQSPAGTTTSTTTPEGWAKRINRRVGAGLAAFIQAGIELVAAKKALGHGGFGDLFKSGLVEIDQRTAEMLMRVAKHATLANPNNYSILPRSLNSLNKLAALDVTEVEQAIAAGEITPGMTISDAQKFVRSKREPRSEDSVSPTGHRTATPRFQPEPMTPVIHERQPFDRKAFKERLTAFLESEYVKHHPNCADLMRSATAFTMTDFFRKRVVKVSIAKPGQW